jgi:hypothetical protein
MEDSLVSDKSSQRLEDERAGNKEGSKDRPAIEVSEPQGRSQSQPNPTTSAATDSKSADIPAHTEQTTKQTIDSTTAPIFESTSPVNQTVAPVTPAWLPDYNALDSLIEARGFRKKSGATPLIVSQRTLEKQRVALDEAQPVLLPGAGSYWCIYDKFTKIYFLLLNRETFRFNDTNYESITTCYDFNELAKQDIKLFKSNDYRLNAYQVLQPAQVVPTDENGEAWQLSLRGRLSFARKTPT